MRGWTNKLFSNDGRIKKMARERMAICSGCTFNSSRARLAGYPVKPLPFVHCIHCECELEAKTHDPLSNCGIEKYNAKHPEHPLKLKWTAVKL